MKDSLSIQIFKINANVKGIEKLVDKLNGQPGSATARNPRDALSVHATYVTGRRGR